MRAQLWFIVMVAAAACGGNWSNRDVDFANALPDRVVLKSKLPETATSTNPLTGVETRRDGLVVGDPSSAYADTRAAQATFNKVIDDVLTLVEAIRKYPPTDRTDDSRTWGPFADEKNRGAEFRLVVTQSADSTFHWSFEEHPANSADYFRIVSGEFRPTDNLKRGQGTMVVHVQEFRPHLGTDDSMKYVDQIDIGYVSDSYPLTVSMLYTFTPGNPEGFSTISFVSRKAEDGSGALQFTVATPNNPKQLSTAYSASWLPSGAGRAAGVVQAGEYAGATATQCWSGAFLITYYNEGWPAGMSSGNPADCVEVPGF